MNSRKRAVAAGISLLIYAAIFLLSSLPARSLPSGIPDIVPHILEFAALAFFLIQVFPGPARPPALAMAFILAAILGMLDEWHQLSVPGRVFSLLDWGYDLAGGLAGLAAFRFLADRPARGAEGRIRRWGRVFLLRR
jgi:VanZ family protein